MSPLQCFARSLTGPLERCSELVSSPQCSNRLEGNLSLDIPLSDTFLRLSTLFWVSLLRMSLGSSSYSDLLVLSAAALSASSLGSSSYRVLRVGLVVSSSTALPTFSLCRDVLTIFYGTVGTVTRGVSLWLSSSLAMLKPCRISLCGPSCGSPDVGFMDIKYVCACSRHSCGVLGTVFITGVAPCVSHPGARSLRVAPITS